MSIIKEFHSDNKIPSFIFNNALLNKTVIDKLVLDY